MESHERRAAFGPAAAGDDHGPTRQANGLDAAPNGGSCSPPNEPLECGGDAGAQSSESEGHETPMDGASVPTTMSRRQQSRSSIEQQRLLSGRNRLGTPRHGSLQAKRDNSQLIDLNTATSATDHSQSEAPTLVQTTSGCAGGAQTNTESELSLASQLNQAPPSYRKATRDQPRPAVEAERRLENHNDSYGFLKFAPDKDQAPVAGEQLLPGPLAAAPACVTRARPQRDEAIYATLNARYSPSLALARLPINHVISAGASMQQHQQQQQQQQLAPHQQWPPQTNQLQRTPCAALMGAHQAARMSSSRTLPHSLASHSIGHEPIYLAAGGQHQPRMQLRHCSTLSSSSLAALRCSQQSASANLAAQLAASTHSELGGRRPAPLNQSAGEQGCRSELAARLAGERPDTRPPRPNERQQQHRKRRRHRSASGQFSRNQRGQQANEAGQMEETHENRLEAPLGASTTHLDAAGKSAATPISGSQAGRAAISAHCWLIDSSDDNCHQLAANDCAAARSRTQELAGGAGRTAKVDSMMENCPNEGAQALANKAPAASTCERSRSANERAPASSSRTLGGRAKQQQQQQQRQHRRANRSYRVVASQQHHSCPHEASCRAQPMEGLRSSRRQHEKRRAHSSSSGGTLARLSAVLSLVSSLLPTRPKSLPRSAASEAPSGCCSHHHRAGQHLEWPHQASPIEANSRMPYSLTSVASSSLAPSTGPSGSSRALAGAASLAYSSSTNTSAYVTGSSHSAHSHVNCNGTDPLLAARHQGAVINLVQLNCADILQRAPELKTHVAQPAAPSWQSHHSYEYCDQEAPVAPSMSTDCAYNLRRLGGADQFEQIELEPLPARLEIPDSQPDDEEESAQSSTGSSGRQSMSPAQLVGLNQGGFCDQSRLAQILMSDNELISAASDAAHRQQLASGQSAATTLEGIERLNAVTRNCRVAGSLPASARRRWRWNSLKLWFSVRLGSCLRQTCAKLSCSRAAPVSLSTSSSSDECHNCPPGASIPPDSLDRSAPSYQSLKSFAAPSRPNRRANNSAPRQASTLQNVISLAKVDRIFRCRLLASVAVSIALLVLICMLGALIYRGGNVPSFYLQANIRAPSGTDFSLLPDDSDLSWLWPAQKPPVGAVSSSESQFNGALNQPGVNGSNMNSREANLKALLHVIERSERLQQFQIVATHLTNLQLAQDQFIDITQLSLVLFPSTSQPSDEPNENATASTRSSPTLGEPFSQQDLDLVTLTLLSNVHWPLIKWRHQSQQSLAANFLSFALSPSAPTVSFGGAQTMRNLLCSLILAESLSVQAAANYANLEQFHRLNANLRKTAHHLLLCSASDAATSAQEELPTAGQLLEVAQERFCRLLVGRYRRTMTLLSQLNHNDLAELHGRQVEVPPVVFQQQTPEASMSASSSSKNILNFLLDRLAPLDVRTLAELTLSSLGPDELLNESTSSPLEQTRRANELVESLIAASSNRRGATELTTSEGSPVLTSDLSAGVQGQLFELARSVVGESPLGWLAQQQEQSGAQFEQYRAKFEQLRSAEPGAWQELLARELLDLWPASELPSLAQPNNYDLFLHPNLSTHLIYGMSRLELTISRPTRLLVLNCEQLNLIEVKLWEKQHALSVKVNDSSTQNSEEPLRPIPIRRVLLHNEKMLIELAERLEPFTASSGAKSAAPTTIDNRDLPADHSLTSAGLDFGELTSAHSDQHHATTSSSAKIRLRPAKRYARNVFVLSISFNKTNLMQRPGAVAARESVEFLDYADFFAIAPTSGSVQEQAHERVRAVEEQLRGASTSSPSHKSMLLSEFSSNRPARRLFPCFDEARFKARFQLNLVHDQAHQVVFNTERRERIQYNANGQLQMSVFEQTPVELSPNSLSLIVCDLHNIKSLTSRLSPITPDETQQRTQQEHIQVQVWAQFINLSQAEYVSQLAPQLLAFLQTHLQLAYPLNKLDLVAVPASGESRQPSTFLGAVLLDENRLLLDTNLMSQQSIEQISLLIGRQLSRLYLGNIVTPARGAQDDWLFAALSEQLGSLALASVQPDWHLDEQFPLTSIRDVLKSEQPAEQANADLEEASSEQSDPIWSSEAQLLGAQLAEHTAIELVGWQTERKRCAVLHMLLMNLLPDSEGRARLLRRLLKLFQYKSMNTRQFWHHFSEQLLLDSSTSGERRALFELEPSMGQAEELESASMPNISSQAQHSERVVFIQRRPTWHTSAKRPSPSNEPTQQYQQRAPKTTDSLELVASSWLERSGFPLITAACYRDRLQLRQERFVFSHASRWPHNQVAASVENASSLLETGSLSRPARASGNQEEGEPEGSIWPVPLMFVSRLNPRVGRFLWLAERELEFPLQADQAPYLRHTPAHNTSRAPESEHAAGSGSGATAQLPAHYSWFKLNHNQTSLARVNYDERNWEALSSLLARAHYSNHLLNPLDRANLLDDALVLMRYGRLSVGLAMNLTLYLELGERDFQPWSTVLAHLDALQPLLSQNPLWQRYVLRLIQPIGVVLGWKDDGPHLMRKLRGALFRLAIQYGDERVVGRARADFRLWIKPPGHFLVPNLQELALLAGVRYGDQQEWFHCWQRYQSLAALEPGVNSSSAASVDDSAATRNGSRRKHWHPHWETIGADEGSSQAESATESELRQLLAALASTQNTWLLEQLLNYALEPGKLARRHLNHVVRALGKNPVARLYLWRFVRLNWLALEQRFGRRVRADEAGNSGEPAGVLETMIIESTRHFASLLDYDEVRSFLEAKLKLAERTATHPAGMDDRWSWSLREAMRQSLAIIEANIFWRESVEPKLARWLSFQSSGGQRR